jgi:hypothetical protein
MGTLQSPPTIEPECKQSSRISAEKQILSHQQDRTALPVPKVAVAHRSRLLPTR